MIHVKEHALCSVCTVGVLEFYVPPFSNGVMKEYCPVCAGVQLAPSRPSEIEAEPSIACEDCGRRVTITRAGGRPRKRCSDCKALHRKASAAQWKRDHRAAVVERNAQRYRRQEVAA